MTLTSPEQPKPPESATQEEILVPRNIIRPFARGLSQLSSEPIQKIKEMLSVEFAGNDSEREQIDEMGQVLDGITTTLALLRTARKVKITRPTKDQYKLKFSPETEEEEIPQKGRITIKKSLAKLLRIAVFDSLGNKFAIVLGYSELLSFRGSSDELKEQGQKILEQAQKLKERWGLLQGEGNKKIKQIEILTDAKGNTTLTPIPRPATQP